ncbi:MAG: InlB B-repeat-containing protein, partial [Kiritimatiellaeota bacterium]|nr:InlB B-repeat-containing protein [Kiritimatiellota bacterium]
GWFTAPAGGARVTEDTPFAASSVRTLYAHWTPDTFTVVFDGNGGDPAMQILPQTYGAKYDLPIPPEREGCLFLGWFATVNATGNPLTSSTSVSANTTFHAGWLIPGATAEPRVFAFPNGPGKVTLSPATGKAVGGKPVTLKATANGDALFVAWEPTGETTATISVAPTTNAVYWARFQLKADFPKPEIQAVTPSPNRMVGVPFAMQVAINDAARPVKFSATKLPSGLKINAATGVISGVPTKAGAFATVVKVTSVADGKKFDSVPCPVTIEPLPWNAQGTFTGWVVSGPSAPRNDVACGSFTATISATGKLSAKVVSTNGTWSFSAPSWTDKQGDRFTASATTKKGQTLALELDAALPWNACQMSGELNEAYDVTAQRNAYINKKDPNPDRADALNALALYKGYYTLAFGGTVVPDSWGAATNVPMGYGYLAATVDAKKGTVKLAGKLADGTSASGSATLWAFPAEAEAPCFILLYGKRGFASGTLSIAPDGQLGGDMWHWNYPGKTTTGKNLATEDRFTMTLAPDGARYATAETLASHFAGCHFIAADADIALALADSGKGAVALPKGNPAAATFSANAKTGVFSGKFALDLGGKKPATLSHAGILVKRPDPRDSFGAGYFLVPEKWGAYTLKRSSPVTVE